MNLNSRPLRWIFFDIGETIVDETRLWSSWADWLGVPRFAFMATLGGYIARGEDHWRALEHFRPGIDRRAARTLRAAAGRADDEILPVDLYPDARPCLATLRTLGYRLGIVGNQPERARVALAAMDLPADLIATSATWGVEKPSPAFFARLVAEAAVPAAQIAYVGDRVDNDVAPAKAAGLYTVFLIRGPWAALQRNSPQAAAADLTIDSLAELPSRLPTP